MKIVVWIDVYFSFFDTLIGSTTVYILTCMLRFCTKPCFLLREQQSGRCNSAWRLELILRELITWGRGWLIASVPMQFYLQCCVVWALKGPWETSDPRRACASKCTAFNLMPDVYSWDSGIPEGVYCCTYLALFWCNNERDLKPNASKHNFYLFWWGSQSSVLCMLLLTLSWCRRNWCSSRALCVGRYCR